MMPINRYVYTFSYSMREVKEGKISIQGRKAETLEILVRHAYAESISITTSNAQVRGQKISTFYC